MSQVKAEQHVRLFYQIIKREKSRPNIPVNEIVQRDVSYLVSNSLNLDFIPINLKVLKARSPIIKGLQNLL
jgi:hypothetical protein